MDPIEENVALKTTLCTRPLLGMMLHKGTRKNTKIKGAKCLFDRCLVSLYLGKR